MGSRKTRRRSLVGSIARSLGKSAFKLVDAKLGDRAASPESAKAAFDPERYRHLRIMKIVEENTRAKSFYFEELDRSETPFQAGQYLTVEVYLEGRVYRRAYSLMSPALPGAPRAFTVERIKDGKVSNHLLDFYEEGMLLRARGPSGDFTLDFAEERLGKNGIGEIHLFASGNGVTPILSLIETLLAQRENRLTLIKHDREGEPRLFEARVDALAKAHGERLRVERIQGLDSGTLDPLFERLRAARELIEARGASDAPPKPLVYLCGPRSFRETLGEAIEREGIRRSRIIEERFESPPSLALVELPEAPQPVALRARGETYRFEVPQGTTLLDAAIESGAPLPHRCMIGDCASCVVRVESGEAWSATNDALSKREREQGIILACVSHPLSEMEIEIP